MFHFLTCPLFLASQAGKGGGVHDWELSIIMEYCDQVCVGVRTLQRMRVVHLTAMLPLPSHQSALGNLLQRVQLLQN